MKLTDKTELGNTYQEYIDTMCHKMDERNGVSWYSHSNVHYIVFDDQVGICYGYHGKVQFEALADGASCPVSFPQQLYAVSWYRVQPEYAVIHDFLPWGRALLCAQERIKAGLHVRIDNEPISQWDIDYCLGNL